MLWGLENCSIVGQRKTIISKTKMFIPSLLVSSSSKFIPWSVSKGLTVTLHPPNPIVFFLFLDPSTLELDSSASLWRHSVHWKYKAFCVQLIFSLLFCKQWHNIVCSYNWDITSLYAICRSSFQVNYFFFCLYITISLRFHVEAIYIVFFPQILSLRLWCIFKKK